MVALQKLVKYGNYAAARAFWNWQAPSWTLRSGLVVTLKSPVEWVLYNDIFVEGEYDRGIERVICSTPRSTPQILDIGANVGFFTLRFADKWLASERKGEPFRIVGIEGTPAVFHEARRVLGNPLLKDSVELHFGLAGKRSGSAEMFTSAFHGGNSLFVPQRSRTRVPFVDVESLVPSGRIALLKCDIEGSEEMFLEHYPGLLQRTDAAIIELHHGLCDVARCASLLRDAGLTRERLLRRPTADTTVHMFERDSSD